MEKTELLNTVGLQCSAEQQGVWPSGDEETRFFFNEKHMQEPSSGRGAAADEHNALDQSLNPPQ